MSVSSQSSSTASLTPANLQGKIGDCPYQIISVHDIDTCRQTVDAIMSAGQPIAIDCEGMNLGRNGRMTTLQICTWDRHIYILDLIDPNNPSNTTPALELLVKGNVQRLLESASNEKVMHGCNRDSGALFHQFEIELWPSRVLDCQVADMALQVATGVCFPKKNKMNRIAQLYNAPTTQRRRAHAGAIKQDHHLWDKRPLTQEMVEIASYDTLTLIPKLYNELRRSLDKQKAWDTYRQMVGWYIDLQIEPKAVQAERKVEVDKRVGKLLQGMHERYQPSTNIATLTADENRVLRTLRRHWGKWSPYIKECGGMETILALEEKLLLNDIQVLEKRGEAAQGKFELSYKNGRRLNVLCRHPTAAVKEAANALKKKLEPTTEE